MLFNFLTELPLIIRFVLQGYINKGEKEGTDKMMYSIKVFDSIDKGERKYQNSDVPFKEYNILQVG